MKMTSVRKSAGRGRREKKETENVKGPQREAEEEDRKGHFSCEAGDGM